MVVGFLLLGTGGFSLFLEQIHGLKALGSYGLMTVGLMILAKHIKALNIKFDKERIALENRIMQLHNDSLGQSRVYAEEFRALAIEVAQSVQAAKDEIKVSNALRVELKAVYLKQTEKLSNLTTTNNSVTDELKRVGRIISKCPGAAIES